MKAQVGIQISNAILGALPPGERKDCADVLWKKSGGNCFLCGGALNRATHKIFPDHDVAEAEGGKTEIKNLNLVHADCNSWKRNHPTAPAKAFLTFRRFLSEAKGALVYRQCLPFFKITPKASHFERKGDLILIEFPDGSKQTVPLVSEKNQSGTFEYCFVEIPVAALFNDDECQPRTIKSKQIWSIYSDLQRNPLHEPPSCRIAKAGGSQKLMMFDGQHKTIASLLMGRTRISVKIYIGLAAAQARHLVNSIQAKIPKLPLSAMELMSKMGMEYQDLLGDYTDEVPEAETSEAGFLKWLPADARRRGTQAFESACIDAMWSEDGLALHDYVVLQGKGKPGESKITETAAKDKLLKSLVHVKPLTVTFEESETIRGREKEVVTRIIDHFVSEAFAPAGEPPTDVEKEAIARRMYQSSLAYASALIRKTVANILKLDPGECLGAKQPTDEQWDTIENAISRIAGHPVWEHPYSTDRMKDVRDALSKNQNAEKSFKAVGLTIGYALADELDPDWAG